MKDLLFPTTSNHQIEIPTKIRISGTRKGIARFLTLRAVLHLRVWTKIIKETLPKCITSRVNLAANNSASSISRMKEVYRTQN